MKTKKLVVSAILIALATVLSVLQPFQLPFGGGITIASMMPIVIIAYVYGTKQGLFAGLVYAVLQMLLGAKTVGSFFMPGESQMVLWQALCVCFLDYIVAYSVLGFGGVFKKCIKNEFLGVCLGAIFALTLRYIVHIISGAVFFGAWAEWFFTPDGFYAIGNTIIQNFSGTGLAVIYSVFYNGLYMLPEIIITAFVTPIVYFAIKRAKLI